MSVYDSPSALSFSSSPKESSSLAQSPPPASTPFYAQKPAAQEAKTPTAVTLFGFPPSLTSHVLSIFSRYGDIVHHSTADSTQVGGNWLRITYADALAAASAVAANGTLVGGAYMIGCVYAPGRAPDAMDLDRPEQKRLPRTISAPALSLAETAGASPAPRNPGRRLNVIEGEGIFREKKRNSWFFSWFGATEETTSTALAPVEHTQGGLRRMITEFIFGF